MVALQDYLLGFKCICLLYCVGQVDDVKVTDSSDGNFVTISWRPNLIGQPILYYIIDVKQPGSPDFALSKPRNYSASQIRGDIYSVTVS